MVNVRRGFTKLIHRNKLPWKSIFAGHIKLGKIDNAFELYDKILVDSWHPDEHIFVALLKACAKLKDPDRGLELHADVARLGVAKRSLYVGNTLVFMYAKCGLLEKAEEVFDELPIHDVITWTTLMGGYTEFGHSKKTLSCFLRMQIKAVSPNAVTFVEAFKACGSIQATETGKCMHACVEGQISLEKELLICTAIVDMYMKCGHLERAKEVFERFQNRDVVLWNALISGYTEQGRFQEAIEHFEEMERIQISPDSVTLVCALKAYMSVAHAQKGEEIYVKINKMGLMKSDLAFANTIVDIYVKSGLQSIAQQVFETLPIRDVSSWNTLMTGYADNDQWEETIKRFERINLEGVMLNAISVVCCFKVLGETKNMEKGKRIHAIIGSEGLQKRNLLVGNAIVSLYAKCGLLDRALEAFYDLPHKDVVSWTALISGYSDYGYGDKAIHCFENMQLEHVAPNAITFLCILKACSDVRSIDKFQNIQAKIENHVFLQRDLVVGTALVDTYTKHGLFDRAKDLFDKLPSRDAASWNALISGFVENGKAVDALQCFEYMQHEGVSPNSNTFIGIMKACCGVGATEKMTEILCEVERQGLVEACPILGSMLVDVYSKSGLLSKAKEIIHRLPATDETSWTALMSGYAHLGESEIVFRIFDRMVGKGIKPDMVSFLTVLSSCSRAGLYNKSHTYFETMTRDYGIVPAIEHHSSIVDILSRSGELAKAAAVINNMPCVPNLVLWHQILSGCRYWGNVECGAKAFGQALLLDEKDSSAYMLMSQIYANAQLQG